MVRQELDGLAQFSTAMHLIFLGVSAMTVFLMISRVVEANGISIGILRPSVTATATSSSTTGSTG